MPRQIFELAHMYAPRGNVQDIINKRTLKSKPKPPNRSAKTTTKTSPISTTTTKTTMASLFKRKHKNSTPATSSTNGGIYIQRQSETSEILPQILVRHQVSPILVRDGDPATIKVAVRGFPPPTVRWFLGDARLMPSVEYQVRDAGQEHSLLIACATQELEEGIKVTATNSAGVDRASIDVKLYKVLTRHKNEALRPSHPRHRSTETLPASRRRTVPEPQRYKSFSHIETCIDDPYIPEETLAGVRQQQTHIQSTPNIHKQVVVGTSIPELVGGRYRSQTLPHCHEINGYASRSSNDVCSALTSSAIRSVIMDFKGFGPHRSSGSGRIPRSPLLDNPDKEEIYEDQDNEYYDEQYDRNRAGVSTFFVDDPPASRSSGMSQRGTSVSSDSFRADPEPIPDGGEGDAPVWDIDSTRMSSFVKDALQDYNPQNVSVRSQEVSFSQGSGHYSQEKDFDHSRQSHGNGSFHMMESESVLAGNLSQKPPVAPKPKVDSVKKKVKKKDKAKKSSSVSTPDAPMETNFDEYTDSYGTYQVEKHSSTDYVEGAYPDDNSSALLYAPDGTVFKLPMTGEFNPGVLSAAASERESLMSQYEEHSFAIMPNESLNMDMSPSHEHPPPPDLVDSHQKPKTKKKSSKKSKKDMDQSTENVGGVSMVTDMDSGLSVSRPDNLSFSMGSPQRELPAIPSGQEPVNVYEDIHVDPEDYQPMEYSGGAYDPQSPYFRSDDVTRTRVVGDVNVSYRSQDIPADPAYSLAQNVGSVSMYTDDVDRLSAGMMSQSSIKSVPVNSEAKPKTKRKKKSSSKEPKISLVSEDYLPMDGNKQMQDDDAMWQDQVFDESIYEDVHIAGGRRPKGPPPPPPVHPPSPPTEPAPPLTAEEIWSNQQSPPVLPERDILVTDIDTLIPMNVDIPPTHASKHQYENAEVALDYSVPVELSPPSRKAHHNTRGAVHVDDPSDVPSKKPKIAKTPSTGILKTSTTHDTYSQEQTVVNVGVTETNIDDVFTSPLAMAEGVRSPEMKAKKGKKSKKSRGSSDLSVSSPVGETLLGSMHVVASVGATGLHETTEQSQDYNYKESSFGDLAGSPETVTSTPNKPTMDYFQETDIDAHFIGSHIPETDMSMSVSDTITQSNMEAEQNPGKELKPVKKKKKSTKSTSDLPESEKNEHSLLDMSSGPLVAVDIDIDGQADTVTGMKKKVKKKKKLTKSMGDLTGDFTGEIVNIDVDQPQFGEPLSSLQDTLLASTEKKVKKKKKMAKSVGNLNIGNTMSLSEPAPFDPDVFQSTPMEPTDGSTDGVLINPDSKMRKSGRKKKIKSVENLLPSNSMQISTDFDVTNETTFDGRDADNSINPDTSIRKSTRKKKTKSKSAENLLEQAGHDADQPFMDANVVHETTFDSAVDAGIPMDRNIAARKSTRKKKKSTKSVSDLLEYSNAGVSILADDGKMKVSAFDENTGIRAVGDELERNTSERKSTRKKKSKSLISDDGKMKVSAFDESAEMQADGDELERNTSERKSTRKKKSKSKSVENILQESEVPTIMDNTQSEAMNLETEASFNADSSVRKSSRKKKKTKSVDDLLLDPSEQVPMDLGATPGITTDATEVFDIPINADTPGRKSMRKKKRTKSVENVDAPADDSVREGDSPVHSLHDAMDDANGMIQPDASLRKSTRKKKNTKSEEVIDQEPLGDIGVSDVAVSLNSESILRKSTRKKKKSKSTEHLLDVDTGELPERDTIESTGNDLAVRSSQRKSIRKKTKKTMSTDELENVGVEERVNEPIESHTGDAQESEIFQTETSVRKSLKKRKKAAMSVGDIGDVMGDARELELPPMNEPFNSHQEVPDISVKKKVKKSKKSLTKSMGDISAVASTGLSIHDVYDDVNENAMSTSQVTSFDTEMQQMSLPRETSVDDIMDDIKKDSPEKPKKKVSKKKLAKSMTDVSESMSTSVIAVEIHSAENAFDPLQQDLTHLSQDVPDPESFAEGLIDTHTPKKKTVKKKKKKSLSDIHDDFTTGLVPISIDEQMPEDAFSRTDDMRKTFPLRKTAGPSEFEGAHTLEHPKKKLKKKKKLNKSMSDMTEEMTVVPVDIATSDPDTQTMTYSSSQVEGTSHTSQDAPNELLYPDVTETPGIQENSQRYSTSVPAEAAPMEVDVVPIDSFTQESQDIFNIRKVHEEVIVTTPMEATNYPATEDMLLEPVVEKPKKKKKHTKSLGDPPGLTNQQSVPIEIDEHELPEIGNINSTLDDHLLKYKTFPEMNVNVATDPNISVDEFTRNQEKRKSGKTKKKKLTKSMSDITADLTTELVPIAIDVPGLLDQQTIATDIHQPHSPKTDVIGGELEDPLLKYKTFPEVDLNVVADPNISVDEFTRNQDARKSGKKKKKKLTKSMSDITADLTTELVPIAIDAPGLLDQQTIATDLHQPHSPKTDVIGGELEDPLLKYKTFPEVDLNVVADPNISVDEFTRNQEKRKSGKTKKKKLTKSMSDITADLTTVLVPIAIDAPGLLDQQTIATDLHQPHSPKTEIIGRELEDPLLKYKTFPEMNVNVAADPNISVDEFTRNQDARKSGKKKKKKLTKSMSDITADLTTELVPIAIDAPGLLDQQTIATDLHQPHSPRTDIIGGEREDPLLKYKTFPEVDLHAVADPNISVDEFTKNQEKRKSGKKKKKLTKSMSDITSDLTTELVPIAIDAPGLLDQQTIDTYLHQPHSPKTDIIGGELEDPLLKYKTFPEADLNVVTDPNISVDEFTRNQEKRKSGKKKKKDLTKSMSDITVDFTTELLPIAIEVQEPASQIWPNTGQSLDGPNSASYQEGIVDIDKPKKKVVKKKKFTKSFGDLTGEVPSDLLLENYQDVAMEVLTPDKKVKKKKKGTKSSTDLSKTLPADGFSMEDEAFIEGDSFLDVQTLGRPKKLKAEKKTKKKLTKSTGDLTNPEMATPLVPIDLNIDVNQHLFKGDDTEMLMLNNANTQGMEITIDQSTEIKPKKKKKKSSVLETDIGNGMETVLTPDVSAPVAFGETNEEPPEIASEPLIDTHSQWPALDTAIGAETTTLTLTAQTDHMDIDPFDPFASSTEQDQMQVRPSDDIKVTSTDRLVDLEEIFDGSEITSSPQQHTGTSPAVSASPGRMQDNLFDYSTANPDQSPPKAKKTKKKSRTESDHAAEQLKSMETGDDAEIPKAEKKKTRKKSTKSTTEFVKITEPGMPLEPDMSAGILANERIEVKISDDSEPHAGKTPEFNLDAPLEDNYTGMELAEHHPNVIVHDIQEESNFETDERGRTKRKSTRKTKSGVKEVVDDIPSGSNINTQDLIADDNSLQERDTKTVKQTKKNRQANEDMPEVIPVPVVDSDISSEAQPWNEVVDDKINTVVPRNDQDKSEQPKKVKKTKKSRPPSDASIHDDSPTVALDNDNLQQFKPRGADEPSILTATMEVSTENEKQNTSDTEENNNTFTAVHDRVQAIERANDIPSFAQKIIENIEEHISDGSNSPDLDDTGGMTNVNMYKDIDMIDIQSDSDKEFSDKSTDSKSFDDICDVSATPKDLSMDDSIASKHSMTSVSKTLPVIKSVPSKPFSLLTNTKRETSPAPYASGYRSVSPVVIKPSPAPQPKKPFPVFKPYIPGKGFSTATPEPKKERSYKPWTDALFKPGKKMAIAPPDTSEILRDSRKGSREISVDVAVARTQDETRPVRKAPPVPPKPGVSLERSSSRRKQARSMDNLADAVDEEQPKPTKLVESLVSKNDIGSFGLQAYNRYDNTEDEARRERIRTKSVDNLTLLQQRNRLEIQEKTMKNQKQHSKSTGCLLEGRLPKLGRRTLTQEKVYETITTREEIIILKKPTVEIELEPEATPAVKTVSALKRNDGETKRYVGGVMIVDVYDDSNLNRTKSEKAQSGTLRDIAKAYKPAELSDRPKFKEFESDIVNISEVPSYHNDSISSITTVPVLIREIEKPKLAIDRSECVSVVAKQLDIPIQTIHVETVEASAVHETPEFRIERPVVLLEKNVRQDIKSTAMTIEADLTKDEGVQANFMAKTSPRQKYKHQEATSIKVKKPSRDIAIQVDMEDDTPSRSATPSLPSPKKPPPSDDGTMQDEATQVFFEHLGEVQQAPLYGGSGLLPTHFDPSAHITIVDVDQDRDNIQQEQVTVPSDIFHPIEDTDSDSDTLTDTDSGDSYVAADENWESNVIDHNDTLSQSQEPLDTITEDVSELETDQSSDTQDANNCHSTTITITESTTKIEGSVEADTTFEHPSNKLKDNQSYSIPREPPVIVEQSRIIDSRIPVGLATREPYYMVSRPTIATTDSKMRIVGDYHPPANRVVIQNTTRDPSTYSDSWEEVVTYEYEYDKDTGVKTVVLKPKITSVSDKQVFHAIDNSQPPPSRPPKKKDTRNLPEISEDSIVVYEFGEMISMYSDTSVDDIYLNNNMEMGTNATEGAIEGVERAIDIMVTQELEKVMKQFDSQQVEEDEIVEQSSPNLLESEPVIGLQTELAQQLSPAGYVSPPMTSLSTGNDLEISVHNMTPNLKRAVEMLRNKYSIARMSREATPIPVELQDKDLYQDNFPMNVDSFQRSLSHSDTPIDEELMEEVQDEFETMLEELNKMDLYGNRIPSRQGTIESYENQDEAASRSRSGSDGSSTVVNEDLEKAENLVATADNLDVTYEDESDDQVIFGMDDVFIKVVTRKDGHIRKIKIMEGKEGGDTKRIAIPQDYTLPPDAQYSPEDHIRLIASGSDHHEDLKAHEKSVEELRSLSPDFDDTQSRKTPMAEEMHERSGAGSINSTPEIQSADMSEVESSTRVLMPSQEPPLYRPSSGTPTGSKEGQEQLADDLHNDRAAVLYGSSESEEEEDDDEEEWTSESSDDDDDDDDYYQDAGIMESPGRSLSPIAEEVELSRSRDEVSGMEMITESTEEYSEEEEEEDESTEDTESENEDMSLLKELVREDSRHAPSPEYLQASPAPLRPITPSSNVSKEHHMATSSDQLGSASVDTSREEALSDGLEGYRELKSPRMGSSSGTDLSTTTDSMETTESDEAVQGATASQSVGQDSSSMPDDILSQKLAVEGVLSSLGTMFFLIMAAIIFHMVQRFVDDEP